MYKMAERSKLVNDVFDLVHHVNHVDTLLPV